MKAILRILSYLKGHKKEALVAYASLAIATGAELVIPWLIRGVIDRGIIGGETGYLLYAALAVIGFTAIAAVFTFARSYLTEVVAQRVAYDIRNESYARLVAQSFSYFDRTQTGQLMSRLTEDVEAIRRFVSIGVRNAISLILLFSGVAGILFLLHWKLALLSLSLMPLLAIRAVTFGRALRPLFMAVQRQFAAMTTTLQENLAGARVVKAFAREDHEMAKFSRENQALLDHNMAATRLWALNFPLMTFITSLSTVLILWYGGREVLAGSLSVGTLVAFNSYVVLLAWPIRMVGWVANLTARAMASGERVFEVLDEPCQVKEPDNPVSPERVRGDVQFERVSFSYDGKTPVLQELDITARAGELVALVGATGSGKTTLVHLLPRFYDVTEGRVLLDGIDIRLFSLAALRRNVGVVMQDSYLFSMSIRENIAIGRLEATDEEIVEAARTAQIHGFITDLPDGYGTLVGERGMTLSGGQRQRIAIARTILMDPPVLVLDDATSSVDLETEHLIRRALRTLVQGRTTFVISQRLSTIKDADQILVLEHGRIVERGKHADLLRAGGTYARIYDLQLRDQEDMVDIHPGKAV